MTISTSNNGEMPPVKKKKGPVRLVLFLLLLLLVIAGGTAYYLHQRQLPEKTVEAFLNDMKKMDFHGMASHLQSSDLSALDNADIRNEAYGDFFKKINSQMSYQIKKNQFDFQNGTANITVLIKYVDGSNIYQEAISDFLRQLVSAALSGEDINNAQEEAQKQLASLLAEKASSVETRFTETELTYPLIRENHSWKIVALNEDTVKIMSANFKNAAEEIQKTLQEPEKPSSDAEISAQTSPEEDSAAPEDVVENTPESTEELSLSTESFSIQYTDHTIEKDFAGKPCLLVYYDYTNTSSLPSSAMVDVSLQAFQNDTLLTAAIPEKNNKAVDRFFNEVQPGDTINICQVFSLENTDAVTVKAESISDTEVRTASQTLKLK